MLGYLAAVMINESIVRQALKEVKYPGFSRDIVSFGLVKNVVVEGSSVEVFIEVQTTNAEVPEQIFKDCHQTLDALKGVETVKINIDVKNPEQAKAAAAQAANSAGQSSIPGIKKIIAVASGKGGVGKSTVSSNLAVALAKSGQRVGLCDCDLYGPSMALIFGSKDRPLANEENEIIPVEAHGVKLMSMGLLLEENSPVIVRGPLATRYTQQFLRQCAWGELDYLILDLPPGTGDIQLSIVQTVAVDGALIVTTPQEMALIDARKAVSMFAKVNVPILGLVENMAYFECPSDGKIYHIFGQGGGKNEAQRLKVPLLAELPIDMQTREMGDSGRPIALLDPTTQVTAKLYADIAAQLHSQLS